MPLVDELSEEQITFLEPFLPSRSGTQPADRPFVTVTYASSLDGMISLSPGARTTLSGAETKSMTHYLRLEHDAILVGVGTAVADNPSLNCRYPGVLLTTQPRPFILDPKLRWHADGTSVLRLAKSGEGKTPCIVHRADIIGSEERRNHFEMLSVGADSSGQLAWSDILAALKADGVQSLMIEGGAMILNSLLIQPDLVDAVIITIAPTWLGQGGVHVSPAPHHANDIRVNAATLTHTTWKQFGLDVVLCGRLR